MIAQAVVSLLNIGAPPAGAAVRRERALGQAPARDLEQVRDAIDAVRALLEILERRIPQELGPLRDALSRLQMAYAREAGRGARRGRGGRRGPPARRVAPRRRAGRRAAGAGERPQGPGPAESSGRLWVPGR